MLRLMKSFKWLVRVYYEDTDASGVVYYANYLKFMERARTEWLRRLGFEQDALRERDAIVFVVRSLDVEYRRPARFNQRLEVFCRVHSARRVSITFAQDIVAAGAPETALCHARVQVACIDAETFRPKAMPQALLTEIRDAA